MVGTDVAERLQDVLARLFGAQAPVRIRAWDGSEAGPVDGPIVEVRSRRAVRRLLWRSDEVGLARAYVAGELDVDGDLLSAVEQLTPYGRKVGRTPELSPADRRELLRTAVLLGAVGPQPKPPEEEFGTPRYRLPPDKAGRGIEDADRAFYERMLGSTLVYSGGYWSSDSDDLDAAQQTKLDVVCRSLGLGPGMRLLDLGCGWGGLLLHAAKAYGVTAVGVTVSAEQAEQVSKRAHDAGVSNLVEVRVAEAGEIEDAPYDAITSLGASDFFGPERYAGHIQHVAGLLRPGGRLLVLQATRRGEPIDSEQSFLGAYLVRGGALSSLSDVLTSLEEAGLEVRQVDGVREHYARTLRAWTRNLESQWAGCAEYTTPGQLRAWHLGLAVMALAFDSARLAAYQVVAIRPHTDGRSGLAAGVPQELSP